MSGDPTPHLIPYDADPLERLAHLLIEQHAGRLPRLGHCLVLFPTGGPRQRFRRRLLRAGSAAGIDAIIPPYTGSLQGWLLSRQSSGKKILGQTERELLLLQALADFPGLIERYGTWSLIDSLLSLFDELTLNLISVPPDTGAFVDAVEQGYGTHSLAPLSAEAELVHKLWQAWQIQLKEIDALDEAGAWLNALQSPECAPDPGQHIYLCGFLNFRQAEIDWIRQVAKTHAVHVLFHGDIGAVPGHPGFPVGETLARLGCTLSTSGSDSAYGTFLEHTFSDTGKPLIGRASAQRRQDPASPATGRLAICRADHPEHEARIVDLQVRRWLLQGIRDIGIVTNDRRLARRVRALLERANIVLLDSAGWTLSTTSAASAVVRWLDCIQSGFHYIELLDCLKSPFLLPFIRKHGDISLIARFEEYVVYQAQVTGGLARYKNIVENRAADIDARYDEGAAKVMQQLLDSLDTATASLRELYPDRGRSARDFFTALENALSRLGLDQTLASDAAGNEVLNEIQELVHQTGQQNLQIGWTEFHTWLTRNLERRKFRPPIKGNGVELMGLSESRLCRFQALVIAGTTQDHLPGAVSDSPFFNEGVRQQFGLPSRYQTQRERLADFRRLLESGTRVLVTYSQEKDHGPALASPWVERIQAFHQLSYGHSPDDNELVRLARHPKTLIRHNSGAMPEPERPPRSGVDIDLLPQQLSATGYQTLVDCPFRFYANLCLALTPFEEVSDDIDKSDYGSRIHRILQAFHGGIDTLPGPFQGPLNEGTFDAAEKLLLAISLKVFAPDTTPRLTPRGWLYLWQRTARSYLEWQMAREQTWHVGQTEASCQTGLLDDPPLQLKGRLDRLDRGAGTNAIVDYKTGKAPAAIQVRDGESVQLPFYALLVDDAVDQVCALEIGDGTVNERSTLQGDALQQLVTGHRERLTDLFRALASGTSVPAWGDAATCQRCHHAGVCRRELWESDYETA